MTKERRAEAAEPRTVDSPEVLKALWHPLRLRILRHLSTAGPATSTTLAAALGENTGTLSYHLRMLERSGLIEDIPERSTGRERWWRGVRGLDIRRPPQGELRGRARHGGRAGPDEDGRGRRARPAVQRRAGGVRRLDAGFPQPHPPDEG
ncbi:hypothetical protein SMICM17S_04788 [Streptomyces microflavus]